MMGVVVGLLMCFTSCCSMQMINDTFPSKSHLVLPEIHIKGNALVAKRRGDTLVFTADRFKRQDALRVEQLISNVPGFQVDPNGNISFNGRPIKKIMLDGDDLAAENYQLISRNLRSLMVDSIQVIEKFTDNRLLKNIQGQNDIAVNLVLKQSFYGKPNINSIAAYSPKSNGELQTELIQLKNRNKQIITLNANSIGSRSLQQDLEAQQASSNKLNPMYRSWPEILNNTLSSALDVKYVNQNKDWSVSIANTMKIDNYNRLRINLTKAAYLTTNTIAQHQLFSSFDDQPVLLFSNFTSKNRLKETRLLLHWEKDKRNTKRTTYEVEGYLQQTEDFSNELRQLTEQYNLNATRGLSASGFRFKIDHTLKTKANHIWQWEAIGNGSINRYKIAIHRSDIEYHDSLINVVNQLIRHYGVNGQVSIGHIRTTKNTIARYWFRGAMSHLYSAQDHYKLEANSIKSYVTLHLTRTITKKIHYDMQSSMGYTQIAFNNETNCKLIYHLDQVISWKPKATRQLSLSYGILKQDPELRRFFSGNIYTNATLKVAGPAIITYPVTLYSQLHFSLLDLYRGVNLYTQLMFREVKGDYFMSTTLEPFYTILNHLIAKRQSSASFNFQLEKIIHPIRVKYRILYTAMHVQIPAQFNAENFTAVNTIKRFGQHISTNWRKGFNLQFEYYINQSQFLGIVREGIKNRRHDYKVLMELQFSKYLNAHLVVHRYTGRTILPVELVDFKINWIPESKYRIYFTGNNILNRKLFVQQILNVNSITTNQENLIGRRIIVGLDLPL